MCLVCCLPSTQHLLPTSVRIVPCEYRALVRSADERTGRSIVFLDSGACVIFVPEEGDSVPAYFKFGARSSSDSSDFTHIPNTIATCASLDGFDVVFSQAGSALLHCLPLGDYDGTQEFVPALSFTRMPGTYLPAPCIQVTSENVFLVNQVSLNPQVPFPSSPVFQKQSCLQLQMRTGH